MLGSASKNRELGKMLQGADGLQKLHAVYTQKKAQNTFTKIQYDVWNLFSVWRDLSRQVFHGSVLSDLLDNGQHLIAFAQIGQNLCKKLEVEMEADFWKKIMEKAKAQSKNLKAVAAVYKKKSFEDEELDDVISESKGFDCSIEFLKDDIAKYKAQGTPSTVFTSSNSENTMSITAPDLLEPKERVPLGFFYSRFYNLEDLTEVQQSAFNMQPFYFSMAALSGRTSVSVDYFALTLAEFLQAQLKTTEKLEACIENFVKLNATFQKQYSFDFRSDADL